jgi:hypothetical protein
VHWSQPPDLDGFKALSEINESIGMDVRVADDFTLPKDADITSVVFWGGPFQGTAGDPGPTTFNVQILSNSSCRPSAILLEVTEASPAMDFEGYDSIGDAVYRYEVPLAFRAHGDVTYWLVAQAVGQSYPPLWGRLQATVEIDCGAMWHDGWYWEWTECADVLGFPFDASFELIDDTGAPGACCRVDGSCAIVTQQDCVSSGGIWLGPDFACEPDPCTQETGACCLPDLPCMIESVLDCLASGGAWQGVGTTCHPDPCGPTPIEKTTWGTIKAGFR